MGPLSFYTSNKDFVLNILYICKTLRCQSTLVSEKIVYPFVGIQERSTDATSLIIGIEVKFL